MTKKLKKKTIRNVLKSLNQIRPIYHSNGIEVPTPDILLRHGINILSYTTEHAIIFYTNDKKRRIKRIDYKYSAKERSMVIPRVVDLFFRNACESNPCEDELYDVQLGTISHILTMMCNLTR